MTNPKMLKAKTSAIADSGNQEGKMWPSEEWASKIADWANIALIGSLAAGVISTVLVVWMGNVKEAYLRLSLSRNEVITAGLEKQAADAKAAQQRVETDLSKQRERTAIAERSLLELQEKVRPRRLSEEQKQTLVKLLSSEVPIEPRVFCAMDAPDGQVFKDDFVDVFRRLGWTISPNNTGRQIYSSHLTGILIVVKDANNIPPQSRALHDALRAIGINAPGSTDSNLPNNTFEIRIGSKE